ncbi:MAG: alkaline phosphatase family protein [Candidatus Helarchaeota archaeon]
MKILIIVLDGCSINSFNKAHTPFLDSMGDRNFRTFNCTAVWPTATYTGHSSILTGTYPEIHGMIGNQFFDKNDNKIKHFDNYNPSEYIQAPTLFELLKSINSMAIAEPISKGANQIFPMSKLNKVPLEARNELIFEISLKQLQQHNVKFGVINFAGIDGYGELYGPENKNYLKEISNVDKYISQIYETINEKLIMLITADHGMTKVTKKFNLNKFFEKKDISIRCLDSHRASHLYFEGEKEEILEYVRNLKEIDKIFLKKQTKEIKLFHERTGDIAVSANKEIELEKDNLRGSHGGFSKDEIYVPLFILSKDIEIKVSNDQLSRTFSIVDIAPTVVKLLKMNLETKFQGAPI